MLRMKLWDYHLPEHWQPHTDTAWLWYLARKINYDDLEGLDPAMIQEYLPVLRIDPGRRLLLEAYFSRYCVQ